MVHPTIVAYIEILILAYVVVAFTFIAFFGKLTNEYTLYGYVEITIWLEKLGEKWNTMGKGLLYAFVYLGVWIGIIVYYGLALLATPLVAIWLGLRALPRKIVKIGKSIFRMT